MDTPTTVLLHSLLEPCAFDTPGTANGAANGTDRERDVFSKAFSEHNNNQQFGVDGWSGAEPCILTPPGTDKSSVPGTHNGSIDQELQQFTLPQPPAMPNLVLYPTSPLENEMGRSFVDQKCPEIPILDEFKVEPKIPKTRRRRKQKPLSQAEIDLRHMHFLERNRVAADSCRKRKKMKNEGLEEECRVLELMNGVLKDMKNDLMTEIRDLKEKLEMKEKMDSAADEMEYAEQIHKFRALYGEDDMGAESENKAAPAVDMTSTLPENDVGSTT